MVTSASVHKLGVLMKDDKFSDVRKFIEAVAPHLVESLASELNQQEMQG
jgi:hypothetical protein